MGKRILIVEDDYDNLELVRFILVRAGYETLAARDGREGVEIARRERPDLILMDLAMPEMDGWSASREIKSDPELNHIPVVALTVRSLTEDRIRAMEAGCDGYITKPMNVTDFVEDVRHYIEED